MLGRKTWPCRVGGNYKIIWLDLHAVFFLKNKQQQKTKTTLHHGHSLPQGQAVHLWEVLFPFEICY